MRLYVFTPFGKGGFVKVEAKPSWSYVQVLKKVCMTLDLHDDRVLLAQNGNVVDQEESIGNYSGQGNNIFSIIPKEITAGVDEASLMEEYRFLRQQFPLVKMEDLLTYKGRIRCERGYVKELADRGVWPFTEYVQWHEFKMVLSYLHPFKPPSVTWLTDISHPNIIPRKKGKVCVSIVGKKWLPNTKLAAVVNALYFLLSDPNPYSAYPNKRCKEVAKICRMFGFPLKRKQVVRIIPKNKGV